MKTSLNSLLTLCCVTLFAAGTCAANDSLIAQAVKTSVEREPINTVDPIFRAFISIGADKFTFIIPEKFRLGGDSEKGKLQLTSTENDTTITLSFFDSQELETDTYREMLAKQFENGKFVREFTRPALGHSGHVFDVNWTGAANMARSTSAIFIPTHAGLLEMTITSSKKNFPTAQTTMNSILCSLQASVDGKLEVIHLGNSQ